MLFRRAAAAASALVIADDPERLLWRPSERKIFIPPARWPYYSDAEIRAFCEAQANQLDLLFARECQQIRNAALSAQMERIRNSPLTLIGPFRTVSFQWTDADSGPVSS